MLASCPVSMLNQKPSDLGIPNRFKLDPSRSSRDFRQRRGPPNLAEALTSPSDGRNPASWKIEAFDAADAGGVPQPPSAEFYCDDDLRAVWSAAASAPTPASNWPVVTMFAGKRTVGHSRSRIRFDIAHGLIACVVPTEILRRSGRNSCRRGTHNNNSHRVDNNSSRCVDRIALTPC